MARFGLAGQLPVAVGAPCIEPTEFRRSYGRLQLALRMQLATGYPEQITLFDDLGIYQLLSEIANIATVEKLIHRWLGTLIDDDDHQRRAAGRDAGVLPVMRRQLRAHGKGSLTTSQYAALSTTTNPERVRS